MKKDEIIKDERIEELTSDYVWVDIKKFCELKGICQKTFYNRYKDKFERKHKGRKTLIKIKIGKKAILIDNNDHFVC
ncbi:hypothetical protein [Helicobacter turcicus]|uniref:Uncharacterized protein n=1 Tax=Helicobacter turcicus TaxID=2867412 RepID=A0ABS7JPC9_9HELI|nr:hypothetical protein [Helicobacter turcicus]MBX7491232.1 hypothetical protein [Helicobacter turcicus]MBX7546129.1 hypothetical protein [Helicobacter turcicus]